MVKIKQIDGLQAALDAKIKKASSSTSGKIPKWDGISGDAIIDGYTPVTTVRESGSADDNSIATEKAIRTALSSISGAIDTMVYKGHIDVEGSDPENPDFPAASKGHTYRIVGNGKIGGDDGVAVYDGDIIICLNNNEGGVYEDVGSDWDIIHVNREGEVLGPASSNNNSVATFDGITGKLLKDSGCDIDSLLYKLIYKSGINASNNPNYSDSSKGDVYNITVKGKIGGASGVVVNVGDLVICKTDTIGGTHAAVGNNFQIVSRPDEVLGAGISTITNIPMYSDTSGRLIQDSGVSLADLTNKLILKGYIDASSEPNYPSAAIGDVYYISVAGKIGGKGGAVVNVGDLVICKNATLMGGTHAAVGDHFQIVSRPDEVLGPASSTKGNVPIFDDTSGKLITDSDVGIDDLTGKLNYIGSLNASASPDYPKAEKGDIYDIGVAGKIGGENGVAVGVGDLLICLDTVLSGAQGEVGNKWARIRRPDEVLGPASAVDARIAVFDGTSGKLLKDGGSTIAEILSGQANLRSKEQVITDKTGNANNVITIADALSDNILTGTVPIFSVNGIKYPMGAYESLNTDQWAYSSKSIRVKLPYALEASDVMSIIYNY